MVIEAHQPAAYQALALLFTEPPEGTTVVEAVVRTVDQCHGRLEWRTLQNECRVSGLAWLAGRQAGAAAPCRQPNIATGAGSEEVVSGITGSSAEQANAAVLERL